MTTLISTWISSSQRLTCEPLTTASRLQTDTRWDSRLGTGTVGSSQRADDKKNGKILITVWFEGNSFILGASWRSTCNCNDPQQMPCLQTTPPPPPPSILSTQLIFHRAGVFFPLFLCCSLHFYCKQCGLQIRGYLLAMSVITFLTG